MSENNFKIRIMRQDELSLIIDWAADEGWNPGLSDAGCFYAADPKGFLIGLLDDEPIGAVSAVSYDDSFGFMGFYIIKPEFRGKGYGMKLAQAGIDYLKGKNIGLDGVVEQQENYKKSGFKMAYDNIRYEGVAGHKSDAEFTNLKDVPFDLVKNYDRLVFPAARDAFLKCWVNNPEHYGLAKIDDGKVNAYGVIRPCREGYKIGPLFADNEIIAEDLYLALISNIPSGSKFYLDVPESNKQAVKIAEKYKMEKTFETARMYTKSAPKTDLDKCFGVTSFELG